MISNCQKQDTIVNTDASIKQHNKEHAGIGGVITNKPNTPYETQTIIDQFSKTISAKHITEAEIAGIQETNTIS